MKKAWLWLNGYKTYVGTAFLFVAAFVTQVVLAQWGLSEHTNLILTRIASTLEWFGMGFVGLGFTHKGIKLVRGSDADATQ